MASVTIVLDKRKSGQKKDGSFPIKLRVEHDNKHLTIHLSKHAKIEQWDGDKYNRKYPNSKRANNELNKKLVIAEDILNDYENEIKTWNCKQLRDFIAFQILDEKSEKRDKKIKQKQKKLQTQYKKTKHARTTKSTTNNENESQKIANNAPSDSTCFSPMKSFT